MSKNCECGYRIIKGLKICENCGRKVKPIKLDRLIDDLFEKELIQKKYGLNQDIIFDERERQYFNEPKPKTKLSMRRL